MSRSLGAALLLTVCLAIAPESAQSQTSPADTPQQVRSPKAALLRASVFPGWGQVYNRQYIKLPILYAGIGVLAVSAIQANKDYVLYRNAFQYKAFAEITAEGEVNPKAEFQSYYDEIAAVLGPVSSSPLESHRDNLRRNRDLSILGIAAVWGLGVLDAYVSAHLSSFDVGEDLTLRVTPSFAPTGQAAMAGGAGPEAGVSLTLSW